MVCPSELTMAFGIIGVAPLTLPVIHALTTMDA